MKPSIAALLSALFLLPGWIVADEIRTSRGLGYKNVVVWDQTPTKAVLKRLDNGELITIDRWLIKEVIGPVDLKVLDGLDPRTDSKAWFDHCKSWLEQRDPSSRLYGKRCLWVLMHQAPEQWYVAGCMLMATTSDNIFSQIGYARWALQAYPDDKQARTLLPLIRKDLQISKDFNLAQQLNQAVQAFLSGERRQCRDILHDCDMSTTVAQLLKAHANCSIADLDGWARRRIRCKHCNDLGLQLNTMKECPKSAERREKGLEAGLLPEQSRALLRFVAKVRELQQLADSKDLPLIDLERGILGKGTMPKRLPIAGTRHYPTDIPFDRPLFHVDNWRSREP